MDGPSATSRITERHLNYSREFALKPTLLHQMHFPTLHSPFWHEWIGGGPLCLSTLKGFMITINIYSLRNVCNGGAQMGGGGTAEKNGDRNAKTPSPKYPPNAALLSPADRHGLSDHLSGKRGISSASNGFRWKVQFSGEFGLMPAREKLVNRSDGGEAPAPR